MTTGARRSCFVIMPFGDKINIDGELIEAIIASAKTGTAIPKKMAKTIDFDRIYEEIIEPAAERLDLECIRCDKIAGAGSIHKDMLTHIWEADVAIVDMSTLNANVLYELGVRHALRNKITVLIKREGTVAPFNIHGYRAIPYAETEPEAAIDEIVSFVKAGFDEGKGDSPVYDNIEELRPPHTPIKLILKTERHDYAVDGRPDTVVGLVTGELKNIKGIDVWVNSENRNMQMARFFDRSVSGAIRWLGASKNKLGKVEPQGDVIADELAAIMGDESEVEGGTVLVTGSGQLREKNQVSKIFHAATAQGVRPFGYKPIPDIWASVSAALERLDEEGTEDEPLQSILFPLMGTGTGGADIEDAIEHLVEHTLAHFANNPETRVRRVYFLTPFERALSVGQTVLDRAEGLTRL